MANRGLLSRLGSKTQRPDPIGDVVEHLRVLLNTRQGESLTVPDYGVMDFTDLVHAFPLSINELQQAIRTTISTFEPRLRNVVVRFVPDDDPLVLRFEIVARLVNEKLGIVRLQTQVNSAGRMHVE